MAKTIKPSAESKLISHSLELDLKIGCTHLCAAVENLLAHETVLAEYSKAFQLINTTVKNHGRIWLAGSNSSISDVQGIASNLVGSFEGQETPVNATALGSSSVMEPSVSCAKDGVEIYSRELRASAGKNDCLWLFTSAGGNDRLIDVASAAQVMGIPIITLTGYPGSPIVSFGSAKIRVTVPGEDFRQYRVQEIQRILANTLCYRLKYSVSHS